MDIAIEVRKDDEQLVEAYREKLAVLCNDLFEEAWEYVNDRSLADLIRSAADRQLEVDAITARWGRSA